MKNKNKNVKCLLSIVIIICFIDFIITKAQIVKLTEIEEEHILLKESISNTTEIDYSLLKNNYYTEKFEELKKAYEEKFGPLIVWIIPNEELYDHFEEKIIISLERREDILIKSYGNEEDFIYWRNIVKNMNIEKIHENTAGNDMNIYDKLVKDCFDTDEFKALEKKYEQKFYMHTLMKHFIPEEETLGELSEKIQICIEGDWDILPPSYNWENEDVHMWIYTKEYYNLEQHYIEKYAKLGIKKQEIDIEITDSNSYYNVYDYVHGTSKSETPQKVIDYQADLKDLDAEY